MTTTKPITYHPGVDKCIDGWAATCESTPSEFRRLGELAIRTRHPQAILHDQACGRQPDIWKLDLGVASVIYTVETDAIVVRGYHLNVEDDSLEDLDAGGFFCEASWHFPA